MKKFLFALILISIHFAAHSQKVDTVPQYKKNPIIPWFKILQGDSTWFTRNDLPKNKPVVIVYFNPDCGHCQLTAKEIVDNMDKFKNAFMVWITFHSPDQIKAFAHDYKLDQFNNIKLGRDTSYYIPVFYQVRFTPFMAVYNKQGKFVQAFEGGTDVATLSKYLN
ncbi:MAG: peroxiredoxin family protein [Chitinophagaceae bacterium]